MTTPSNVVAPRSYGCTFGCGNPYDVITIMVADGETQFLCIPCFVKIAAEMLEAISEPDSDAVRTAVEWANANPLEVTPGPGGQRRGRNAPATTDDPDVFGAYDGTITVDELPPEFR